MSYKAVIRLLFVFHLFGDLILIYAVDKLFLLSRNISIQEIAILVAIWSGLTVLLEVPTGALADRWSRKYTLVLSGLFYSLCYITWIFSFSFWPFALGFLFRTIGGTCESGTLQAYTYDFLKKHKKEDEFEKIWGRCITLRVIGTAVAVAAGGYLSEISYTLVLVFSALSPLVVTIIAFLLPEVKSTDNETHRSYISYMRGGLKQAFSNRIILKIMLYSSIVWATLGLLEEYDQVLISERLGFSNTFIGIWAAAAVCISSVGSFFAHRLKNLGWRVLIIIGVATGTGLVVITFVRNPVILGCLLVNCISLLLASVTIEGIIQREIKTEERATISSVCGVMGEIGTVIFSLFIGFIAHVFGIHIGYGILGALILVYISIQFLVGLRK
ncbi:MAG: MFS transporter [Dehalococcoidales bacterium]|nr:MFS transporter [Dehalococcoidales bacterium]